MSRIRGWNGGKAAKIAQLDPFGQAWSRLVKPNQSKKEV
jgi:hypothetical protein